MPFLTSYTVKIFIIKFLLIFIGVHVEHLVFTDRDMHVTILNRHYYFVNILKLFLTVQQGAQSK